MVKRMGKIEKYMETAQFQKRLDKFKFVAGVAIYTTFVYILGRWPADFFYKFYVGISLCSFVFRWHQFKKKNLHYYFLDFCYFGGLFVIAFLVFAPKSMAMYRISFSFGTGILALSTAAFSNKLVFHNFNELVSIMLHPGPLICLWNLKQVTQHHEESIPESERLFVQHPSSEKFFSQEAFKYNFVYPYTIYMTWALIYYMINF